MEENQGLGANTKIFRSGLSVEKYDEENDLLSRSNVSRKHCTMFIKLKP